jgi:hypothetical protein
MPPTGQGEEKPGSLRDPRFQDQKEKIVQILKDWKLPYSMGRGSICGEDPVPYVDRSSFSGGSWPLNVEVERRLGDGAAAKSMRLVEQELAWMSRHMPCAYSPIARVFLRDAAGDADYERLQEEAKRSKAAERLRDELEVALCVLTLRLLDADLYAVFPRRYAKGGRKPMEEHYREIHRDFAQECKRLATRGTKRYRNKALKSTADLHEVSLSTVKRAVHFVECARE